MKKKSLRFKLISLFIILMVANAGVVTWVLYHSLKNELSEQDNNLLVNRAEQLAKLISGGIDIKTLPMYFQSMMDMRQDLIQISDASGHILVATNSELLDTRPLRLVNLEQLNIHAINHWQTTQSIPISAVYFAMNSPLGQLHVVLGKVSVDRSGVLTQYLTQSVLVSALSILLMGLLSLWLLKKGLSDIQSLSQITIKTDVHALNDPIDIDQLPQELKELGESMNTMRQRLKHDFVKLTQFADDLAHELRTPINAIRVQNEITLQRSRNVSEYEEVIISNIEELDKLAQMIQSTLFIARAENKNITLNRENLSISELVNDVYELFSAYAEEKQITLYCEPSTLRIDADPVLLSRVFMNVIANAIKYSHPNTRVVTQIIELPQQREIRITNQGNSLQNSEEIFTRFWRGDNARTTEGTGLGLAIVKAIVELHGGSVSFKHEAGTSTITLTFPTI
ncbi:heavy metal sensor histidine kinase [Providencia sp. wls1922]|uniref:heavy metal sensor histidine kinase n=1 Tax=Providencia sp. wls1922 TaxID=2675152 RepID=UPI0012B5962E|nr:heavy metal sensor histidine kinase [Providencia sp. wls1922]MTC47235.1 heavy metal sensor histidine kinase [Providencia sp. wls1922]